MDLIILVVVFLLILVASYFASKWASNAGMQLQKNKNVKVLEVMRLNQTKWIYLVKIGDKVVSLGVSKEHIEFLTEVEEESLQFQEQGKSEMQFKDFLNLLKQKDKK